MTIDEARSRINQKWVDAAAIFQAIKDVLGRDDLTAAQLPAEIKLRLK